MFQHKSIHWIRNPSISNVNQTNVCFDFIRYLLPSGSRDRSRRMSSVVQFIRKLRLVTQWNVTSLLSCRGFVVVLDESTSCSALKSRIIIKFGVLTLRRTMLTPDYSALLVQSFRSWTIKFDIISRASCIHEPSERNSANSAMKTFTSAENFTQ